MLVNERRNAILKELQKAQKPIPAKTLASIFNVSRQVIVQDIAVIRASTAEIVSTNRGYVIQSSEMFTREFKVYHDEETTKKELDLIVDCGGHVINVSISHRVYGRITAEMDIGSRQDVNEFIHELKNSKSTLLGSATSGYHYHLVEAGSEERLDLIEEQLKKANILAPLAVWEWNEGSTVNE
ncbi:MAG: transcription repressor NadR [Eubacteriaceae bacterium]|nr:transcription repressor NadR [Eubacteriaceae bacterium]